MQLVTCDRHGKGPGYCVCLHVTNGAKVVGFVKATEEELGEALCANCTANKDNLTVDDLVLICAGCYAVEIKKGQI